MKKILRLVAFSGMLAASASLTAQNTAPQCGLSEQDRQIVVEQFLRNKGIAAAMGGALDTRNVLYVPVVFHLVAKSDGTGRVQEAAVISMMCALNEYYRDQNIQYYFRPADAGMPTMGMNYVNNDALYDTPRGALGTNVAVQNKRYDAMNIYIVNNATGGTGQGVTLGYYQNSFNGSPYSADFIMLIKSQVSNEASTIAHEFGHFFTLPHTHNGWDAAPAPFSANPVSANSPGGPVTELVARTNCTTAGDYMCDTPADYNGLNAGAGGACNANQNWYDPSGARLTANNNIMSYFSGCNTYIFSATQKTMIRTDLTTNSQRAYVRRGVTPATATFSGVPTLIAPLSTSPAQPYSNYVQLSWNAVPNATGYFVEISRSAAFDIGYASFFSPTNNYGVNSALVRQGQSVLTANAAYYWRVRPIAQYVSRANGCPDYSANGRFTTGSVVSTQELSNLTSFRVLPNPTESGKDLTILATMNENLEGTIRLTDVAGKLIRSEKRTFVAGDNQITWSTNDLSAGLYILSIAGKEGITSQKVVVTK